MPATRKRPVKRSKKRTDAKTTQRVVPRRRPPVKKRKQFKQPAFDWSTLPWTVIRKAVLAVVLVAIVIGAVYWINDPKNMPITRIEVKGDLAYVDETVLRSALEPYIPNNLYLLDVKGLEARLEAEPWIRSVALYKKWPQTLIVRIEEQRPLAFWGDEKMINTHGEIFDTVLEKQRGVMPVLFDATEDGARTIENYKQVQQWVKSLPVGVEKFVEDARGAWQLTLTNGIKVEVGRQEQSKRIRRLVVGYLKELAEKEKRIDTIDLRYTNGFAVAWKRR